MMSNKNDKNDAKGIAEAVTRPGMKFVAIKTILQQDTLLLHRARELSIKNRTAQGNQIRGLLSDYGIVVSTGLGVIRKLSEILELNKERLSPRAKKVFETLYKQFKAYDKPVEGDDDKEIEEHV